MEDHDLNPSEGVALVTDGSAYWKDRSGGWAFIALDAFDGVVKQSGFHKNATNNQMEMSAPTRGLDYLADKHGPCEVLVYSDSEYVVKGATDKTRARAKNKKWWISLDRAIARHKSVEFIHVKGHNGHIWNEMADDMAGDARKRGAHG